MKKAPLILLIVLILISCKKEKVTEIIILGTLHKPEPNFNSEILFDILENLKPDLILMEGDSSFFTSNFRLKKALNSNEVIASQKYADKYPMTKLRPYGFEGRIQHRINIGSRPTDGLTTKLLDSLNKSDLLSVSEAKIVNKWNALLQPLKSKSF